MIDLANHLLQQQLVKKAKKGKMKDLIYPNNNQRQEYISEVADSYSSIYPELDLLTLEAFAAEIIARISNIISGENNEPNKIQELLSLLNKDNPDESGLGNMFSQASISSESSNECPRLLTSIEELKLYLGGDKDMIEIDIANKAIKSELSGDLQRFVKEVTRKCIKEICVANLRTQSESPGLSPRAPIGYLGSGNVIAPST
jgi:hypothetical protein